MALLELLQLVRIKLKPFQKPGHLPGHLFRSVLDVAQLFRQLLNGMVVYADFIQRFHTLPQQIAGAALLFKAIKHRVDAGELFRDLGGIADYAQTLFQFLVFPLLGGDLGDFLRLVAQQVDPPDFLLFVHADPPPLAF